MQMQGAAYIAVAGTVVETAAVANRTEIVGTCMVGMHRSSSRGPFLLSHEKETSFVAIYQGT